MRALTPVVREMLAVQGFRRLLRVRVTGQFGDGLFQAALFSAVFFNPERATSAGQAAAAFTTLLLPYSLVGPFAGVLLDRWRRTRVLRDGNLLRAVVLIAFAAMLTVTGPTSPAVVTLALLVVSVNRFILSGLSASLPHVVATERLVTANAFTTTLGAGAAAAGGAAALLLRPLFGEDDLGAARVSVVAAVVYVLAALQAARFARDLLGPDSSPALELRHALRSVLRGVVQGAQHVRERGMAARGLAAITAHRFFFGLSTVATLLLYTEQGAIGLGFTGLGQVVVVSVVGGLLAALVTPRVTASLGTQRWVVIVFSAAAVVEVVFGLPYTHPAFLVAAFFLGFAAQASKICVDTLLQESVEDDYRGRVFSFYDTLFNVSFVLAAALSAVVLPPNGKSYVLIGIVAGGYALTALLYAVSTARHAAQEPKEPVVTRG